MIRIPQPGNFEKTVGFATGRAALYAILEDIKNKKRPATIALPDYLCESILQAVSASRFEPVFYQINDQLLPVAESYERALQRASVVLHINYFGLVDNTLLGDIAKSSGVLVIEDLVQDFYRFGKPSQADYQFCSLRKWFPVPDGAYVLPELNEKVSDNGLSRNEFVFYKLAGALIKNYRQWEEVDDYQYLNLFAQGETLLENSFQVSGSELSRVIMGNLDLELIAKKRQRNFQILAKELAPLVPACFAGLKSKIPLVFPVFTPKRERIRIELRENQIYCPVHWPSPHAAGIESSLYERELSLVIDQRYGEEDMMRMVEIVRSCI